MPGYELIGIEEKKELNSIFKNGSILFRHGFEKLRNNSYKVDEFERKFAKKFKSKYSLAVTSGTAALRVALSTLNLKKTDEVITQSFTFVATVEAIVESGAIPICSEIDSTLNMSPESLEKLITKKTKAVILVHMLGSPSYVDKIKQICKNNKIVLIEDTAWGCGGMYKNRFLGTIGDMGTFSFDFAKTITTGEGGMIIFKNKSLYLKAKAWHDHGHENNPKYPRWEDTRTSSGFNFRMNEMQGAVGIAQLKKLDKIVKTQRKNYFLIWEKIKNIKGVNLRTIPKYSYHTADALIFSLPSKKLAINFRKELLLYGISTKILPEAISWHFSKKWKHINQLNNKTANKTKLNDSAIILSKCVSLPINFYMNKKVPNIVFKALQKVLNKLTSD